jgi:preprotein translocase subunit SecG
MAVILFPYDPTPMHRPHKPASLLFRLTAVAAGAFVVTILALIAVVIGNSQSPGARWLNRHAGAVFAVEVAAILGLGFAAMAQDRRRTLRERELDEKPKTPEP